MTFFVKDGKRAREIVVPVVPIVDGGTGEITGGAALTAFGGLNAADHNGLDHTITPLFLLNEANHDARDHIGLTNVGILVQRIRKENTTQFAITVQIQQDGTIPQIGEGEEIEEVKITPQAVGNKILIRGKTVFDQNTSAGQSVLCLFIVGTSDALGVSGYRQSGNNDVGYPYVEAEFTVPAGPLVELTFKLRAGHDQPGTMDVNQAGGTTSYGAASKTWLEVQEFNS